MMSGPPKAVTSPARQSAEVRAAVTTTPGSGSGGSNRRVRTPAGGGGPPAVGDLPGYRAQLDREGVRTPAETVVAGDEAAVRRAFRALADAGVDELQVLPVGPAQDQVRTLEMAAGLAR